MKSSVALMLVIAVMLVPLSAFAQIVPPKPGVDIPQAYYDRIAENPKAFQFERAWIQKAERAKEARDKFLSMTPQAGMAFAALPDDLKKAMMVSGTSQVPVLMGKYSNTGADPYTTATLQTKLFSPPPAASMTSLYDEMSYGNLNLTGSVYGWYQVSNTDTYYEGGAGCYGFCATGKVGAYIKEVLQLADPGVDFSLYDNDGPDGLPNSGDDDGYVDFVAIVQPEIGAECGNDNLWSHRWVVVGWPEFSAPWATNDPSANGGVVKIYDYTIQPALGSTNGCGAGVIEIGVFCHEFGHAFGLPDYYDTDGGSAGIGEWGLMGSGNWQIPTNPVHMTAYSKEWLGWIVPTEVGPMSQMYTVNNSEVTPQAYKLNVMEEKFSRKNYTPISGSYSLHCGLTATDAATRNWAGGTGYGNGWDEAVCRDFSYNGADPVSLQYKYSYHTESGYDYGRVKIEVNGTVSTIVSYHGVGSGTANIDLTPYLTGSGASAYTLIFGFDSDWAYADEDGDFNSGTTGPFKIDDVSVTGGGESYATDFEAYEDGWHVDRTMTPVKEYFLVENRNSIGAQFDQNLNGQGLVIYHVEDDVMKTTLGNSGDGDPGTTARGMMVEEADGLGQLLSGTNRGDAGDVFPGNTSNTAFNSATVPNSNSLNAYTTNVAVENISPSGNVMTADMRGGYFAPTLVSITPVIGDNDQVVPVPDVAGAGFVYGATFLLRDPSMIEYAATDVEWIGKAKLVGTLDLNGVPGGTYDVVVRNPDGQESVIDDGFIVNDVGTGIGNPSLAATNALFQNHPNPFNPTTTIKYAIKDGGHVTLKIYNAAGQLVRTLVDDMQAPQAGGFSVLWNGRNDAGEPVASGVYLYQLTAGSEYQAVKKLVLLK